MKRHLIFTATILSAAFVTPAIAGDAYHSYYGPHGGSLTNSYYWDGNTGSRTLTANGIYGGAASVNGTCTKGEGCNRTWSRTLRNGKTATGSLSAKHGEGISRTGTGFRGRKW